MVVQGACHPLSMEMCDSWFEVGGDEKRELTFWK